MLERGRISLVRILDKLTERGLVERRQHPTDRRIWLLYLREEAGPVLSHMRGLGELTRGEAVEGVPPENLRNLFETLILMKTNLAKSCRTALAEQET